MEILKLQERLVVMSLAIVVVLVVVVHGTANNANQLGGIEASDYVVKGDFAVVTGTITTPAAGSDVQNGSTTLNYPSGFTKDNSVIISLMIDNTTTANEYWSTVGSTGKSSESVRTNYGLQAQFRSNGIYVETYKVATAQGSTTNTVKLVLMKI